MLPTLQLTRAALRRWFTWNCSPSYARITSSLARLFVAFAGTKHYCLTAVNRDGALCCPDFPRDRGLKPRLFFPYPAMNRYTILLVVMYASRRLYLAFRTIEACFVFLVFYREPRGLEVRGAIAIALIAERFLCDKRIATKSGIRESNPPPRLGKPMHYRCANAANNFRCKGSKNIARMQIFCLKVCCLL